MANPDRKKPGAKPGGKQEQDAERRQHAQQRRGDKGMHDGGKGQSGEAGGSGPAKPTRPPVSGANSKR